MLTAMNAGRAVVETLIALLVVARIGRFVVDDLLTQGFRTWVARRFGRGLLYGGLTCRWCVAVWAAIGVVSVWYLISDVPHVWDRWYVDVPALVLALSYGEALIRRLEPEG